MIQIVSMGTGDPLQLTLGALEAARHAHPLILQTGKVPVAQYFSELGFPFETLDALYDACEDFDALNEAAAKRLLGYESAVFFVLGSPYSNAIARAVMNARREAGLACEVLPGVSFAEAALCACGATDALGAIFCVPASGFLSSRYCGDVSTIVTEIDDFCIASEIALAAGRFLPANAPVYAIFGGQASETTLCEFAKRGPFSYDTALFLPAQSLIGKAGYCYEDLRDVLRLLRGEGGCPWDREQTHESLRQYLLEESYEVIDAIDKHDSHMLEDELGDVLMQILFHAQIAEEHQEFDAYDVTTGVCKKMISRHTHIFAQDKLDTAEQVAQNWEKIKRAEKGLATYTQSLEDVPRGMSPLIRAAKVQKKAGYIGFDWEDWRGALEKLREETDELAQELATGGFVEEEAGDLLFAAINVLRKAKINGDVALNRACSKFINRFGQMEQAAKAQGKDLAALSLDEQNALWEQAKALNASNV